MIQYAVFKRLALKSFQLTLLATLAVALIGEVNTSLGGTGLPLPRFVTLRSDQSNIRVGPGSRYPIKYVVLRAGVPVEIIAEFDIWRKIHDIEGNEGWVHQVLLSGRRGVIVQGPETRTLKAEPKAEVRALAQVEPQVIGKIIRCPVGPWCQIEFNGHRGWMNRSDVWGVYPDEEVR
jgi:SH3-like domain-containing protein